MQRHCQPGQHCFHHCLPDETRNVITATNQFRAMTFAFLRAVSSSGRSAPTPTSTNLLKYFEAVRISPADSATEPAPHSTLKRFGAAFRTVSYSLRLSCGRF